MLRTKRTKTERRHEERKGVGRLENGRRSKNDGQQTGEISALLDALQYYVAHHMNAPEGEITLKDNLYAQDIKSKLLEAAIIALTTKPTEDTK